MIAFRRELSVTAPPQVVWGVIADFEGYPTWTSAMTAKGQATVGQMINFLIYVPKPNGKSHTHRFEAKVYRADTARHLAWVCGVPNLLGLTFGFVLDSTGRETHIVHYVEAEGLISGMVRRRLERILPPILEAVISDLQRQLSRRKLRTLRSVSQRRRLH